MKLLSYALATLFGLGAAWLLDRFVFPTLGRLLDEWRNNRNGGAS